MQWTPKTYAEMGYRQRFAWINFVNSEHFDGFGTRTDYLDDRGWRVRFFSETGFAQIQDVSFLAAALKVLRAHLRSAAEQIATTGSVSGRILAPLNKALLPSVHRTIERNASGYSMSVRPNREDSQWIAAQIVASFGAFLEYGRFSRLKICPNPDCRWVFLDETKGGNRRWCNDLLCGNRDKVRRHRAREKSSK